MADRKRSPFPLALLAMAGLALLAVVVLSTDPSWAKGPPASHPQTTLEPRSEVGRSIDKLLDDIVLWVIAIFVVVEGALVITVFRFRRRPGGPPAKPIHGNTALEIGWTLAPAIILAFIAVPTVKTIFVNAKHTPGDITVKVVGHQWWWEFQYPGQGVVITANELHLPVNKTVSLELESADVIHSFWLPAFAGKKDVVPGRTNHLWFTPEETGTFPGQCAEFCGASHANMMFKVVVQPQAEFDAWVAQQKATSPPPDSTSLAARGLAIYQKGQCVACHMIDGVSYGVIGPNLSKVATRSTIAAGMFPNDDQHLKAWIRNAPSLKPGSIMTKQDLSDEDLEAVVAFLRTRR
jgi:cytochrome c oxidase subunit 2